AETSDAAVSRGGEPDKVPVKHFHRPADVTTIDRARLFAFCFEDLFSDAIGHGSPRRPVFGMREQFYQLGLVASASGEGAPSDVLSLHVIAQWSPSNEREG